MSGELLIQVVLQEELTVVVNGRWSLNTGCILTQVVLQEELTVVVNGRWSLNTGCS